MTGSSRQRCIGLFAFSLWVLVFTGCGGGNSSIAGPTPTPTPQPSASSVSVTFTDGTPTAVAVKIGSGAFTATSVQNGQTSFLLPAGTTSYALAYVCPPEGPPAIITTNEIVIEATLADGASYSTSCVDQPPTANATGTVDATAIPGASNVVIFGKNGFANTISAASGSFNATLPSGTNDVAAVAKDASGNVLAVKILRSQTVPGAVNGGNSIVFSAADEITLETATIGNAPAGFIPPELFVQYRTGNGTQINLELSTAGTYQVIPATAAQAGDSYFVDCSTEDTVTGNSVVGVNQVFSSATPLTINLPAVWSNATAPPAAAFPTFALNYTGFTAGSNLAFQGDIAWATSNTTFNHVLVTATSSFQNGSTTLSVPNLASLPGFFTPAASGTTIGWNVIIVNAQQSLTLLPSLEGNGIGPLVESRGTYVVP